MRLPILLALALIAACIVPAPKAQAQQASSPSEQPPAQAAPQPTPQELTINADRPGFSNPTNIVPRGHFQLEAGATAARSGDERDYSFGELLVRVPVSERAEVRLGVPSYLVARSGGQRVSGADDLFVETKIALASGKNTHYALLLNSVLPTGSRAVAEHRFQPGATLTADLTLSDNVGLTLNAGLVRASDNNERFNQFLGAASFNFTLTPKTGAFAEVYAYNQSSGPTQKFFDGGFTYLLNPRLQLDASIGLGLGNRVGGPDYFYAAGVSRLF